jgi:RNA polymerase sigma factor (sigma-70 family)
MPDGQFARVVQGGRRVPAAENADEATDAHLLELFIQQRDEGAFAVLVRRHGPMVLGVCRRVLGNDHDAEDAFQAVFLVLTRKASSVRPREMVGNWLYGVAVRTALEARKTAAKRQRKERHYGELRQADAGDPMDEELLALLDEELNRLPARYRAVLVLCDLESRTRKEVAQHLGCKEGTVASRLDRARKMLAKRLTRRGLVVAGTVLVATLSAQSASAAVPPALLACATKTPAAAGQGTTAGLLSGRAIALAERVLRILWLRRLRTLLGLMLAVILSGLVLVPILFRAGAAPPPAPEPDLPVVAVQEAGLAGAADLRASDLIYEEKVRRPVYSVAFSPDGKYLAAGSGRRAKESKDGATGGAGAVTILSLDAWKEVAHFEEGFVDAVTAVAYAPDGSRLAAGSMRLRPGGQGNPFDRTLIRLWSTKDNREEAPLEISRYGTVDELVFSPDGLRLAVTQSGQWACVLDLTTRAETVLTGPAASSRRIDFTPNGKFLGLLGPGAAGAPQPFLRVWDPATGRELAGWPLTGKEAGPFKFAPRGGLLAAACDDKLHVIDRTRQIADKVIPLGGTARSVAFAPGGRNVAVALAGGEVLLLDGRTGEVRQRWPRDPEYPLVTSVAFSPDGSQLAVGAGKEDGGGVVRVWRGPRVAIRGWGQVVSPDGDCDVTLQGETLVIDVPPTPHDLSIEVGRVNAPRVLQDVEGDFSIQVKVGGALRPTAAGSVPGRLPYQAGGLFVWADNRNYLRLERAALNRDGVIRSAAAFEVRVNGEMGGARSSDLADQDTYLRLERRGKQFLGSVSADGRQWSRLEPLEVDFPKKVRVGVAAVNAARQPLTVRYEGLQLTR